MKILFFGPQLTRSRADHRSRALGTLLEGVFDRGHHVVYVTHEGGETRTLFPFLKVVEYDAWGAADPDREHAASAAHWRDTLDHLPLPCDPAR